MNNLLLDHLAARLCAASYPMETHRLSNMLHFHKHIHGEEHGADVFVGEGPLYNWVVFRGTEVGSNTSWKDVKTDLKFLMDPVRGNEYKLHRGFFEAWREVSPMVTEAVTNLHWQQAADDDTQPWVFTGHSLGAGMAPIAAATLKPTHCVTFGGPRVGNNLFNEAVTDACEWRRWVNRGDWCPRLPPPVFGHRHGGELHYLTTEGEHLINPSKSFLTKEFLKDFFNKWERHCIDNYVSHLERLASESVG